MTIAELFINLGVKGDSQAQKSLTGVKGTLGEISTTAFAAKAGILGLMYGMERLMSASAQAGMGFQQFETFTGLSAETLQRWQFAARQVGVSNEEMAGSLKSVQQAMTNTLLGKPPPEGLQMVAKKVGLDQTRLRDTFYVMEQLQKFARTTPPDLGNAVLKSFGLGEGTIQAMRKNAFNPQTMAKAPIYKEGEIAQLAKVDVAWSNISNKIQMAFGHLNAKHGLTLTQDISKLVTQVMRMVDAFATLGEKLKLIQWAGKMFDGWGKIFGAVTNAIDNVNKNKGGVLAGIMEQSGRITQGLEEAAQGAGMTLGEHLEKSGGLRAGAGALMMAAPPMSASPGANHNTQNINVKQDLHFNHDGKDHQRTGDSTHRAIKGALRQMPSQGQAT